MELAKILWATKPEAEIDHIKLLTQMIHTICLNSQDYSAKLSDFGLAKDGPQGDETHVTTRVMGTHGYAAPEYIMTGTDTIYTCMH